MRTVPLNGGQHDRPAHLVQHIRRLEHGATFGFDACFFRFHKPAPKCESFMKTLKYEEVYRNEYRDFQEAHASVGEFLERVYNERRLHSALGYRSPAEFEQNGGPVS
jgi:Integrase core domain